MTLEEIFQSLKGNWSFIREITDLKTDITEHAKGKAAFIISNNPNVLHYQEQGELTLRANAKKIKFSRKYIYQLKSDSIDIILDDGVTKGKLFQTLTRQEDDDSFVGSEHSCRLDKHNGSHHFDHDSAFHTTYTVIGPNSDLLITTHYIKQKENNVDNNKESNRRNFN